MTNSSPPMRPMVSPSRLPKWWRIAGWETPTSAASRLPSSSFLTLLHERCNGAVGAGGIGLATARRLMDEGACVMLCDIDRDALKEAEAGLKKQYGSDVVGSCWMDVTREDAVLASFSESAWKFGGMDLCISNAGIASASPVDETSLATWQRNMDILSTGYFLVARQAFQLMKAQAIGGSIVFIGSKNALAASPGAAAYCTAVREAAEKSTGQRIVRVIRFRLRSCAARARAAAPPGP
mgnify:CR=1 FL=1